MMMSLHISIQIDRSPESVYAFVSDPANLPKWAAGLSGAIQHIDGEWIADSPMGRVKVRFVAQNTLGVLDHEVTLPSGVSVYNPMRVIPNGNGSEFVFTLYRQPEMSDEQFTQDAGLIKQDLATLKALLEHR